VRIKKLSRDETEIVKIILALVEGFDTVEKISRVTKLKKYRITRVLYTLKHAGVLSIKPGTRQWRIKVNALYFWNTAQGYAYEQGVYESLSKLKEAIDAQTRKNLTSNMRNK